MCTERWVSLFFFFFFQAEDGIRDGRVTGVQTCALPIWGSAGSRTNFWTCRSWRASRSRTITGSREAARDIWRSRRTSTTRSTRKRTWSRSEERRVGKECRSRWEPYHEKKKEGKEKKQRA